MKIQLITFERLSLKNWLERQEGNIGFIRQAVPLAEKLDLSKDEKALVKFVQIGDKMTWADTEHLFEFELNDAELALIKPALSAEWPATRPILAMLEKLEDVLAQQSQAE